MNNPGNPGLLNRVFFKFFMLFMVKFFFLYGEQHDFYPFGFTRMHFAAISAVRARTVGMPIIQRG